MRVTVTVVDTVLLLLVMSVATIWFIHGSVVSALVVWVLAFFAWLMNMLAIWPPKTRTIDSAEKES